MPKTSSIMVPSADSSIVRKIIADLHKNRKKVKAQEYDDMEEGSKEKSEMVEKRDPVDILLELRSEINELKEEYPDGSQFPEIHKLLEELAVGLGAEDTFENAEEEEGVAPAELGETEKEEDEGEED